MYVTCVCVFISASVTKFSYADTRLAPASGTNGAASSLKVGEDCEVLSEGKNEDDPSGWWPASVKLVKGEFYVVDYKIQDDAKYSDIVSSDKIRTPNKK